MSAPAVYADCEMIVKVKEPQEVERKLMGKGQVLFTYLHPTTHSEPTFVVDGIVHYCVANMPGAVARTSTYALNNVTLPHILSLADAADRGSWKDALKANPHLAAGLNIHQGKVTCEAVARELGYDYVPVGKVLAKD